MCLHLIELLSGFRSHSKRIKISSKSDLNMSGSILDDILPIYESPTKTKTKKKSIKKYSTEFEKILLKKLILPKECLTNEQYTKFVCRVNLSSKTMPTPRSILRIKRRRSDHIPMERTPKRVKLDVSDNSTEKKLSRWNKESTEEDDDDDDDDDSDDDDYNKSDSKKHKKSAKKSIKKIKEECSKKKATRILINSDSSDEEIIKSPRKLRSPIMFKGVNSSDEDPLADSKFKKMIKRQSIESPEKSRKNPTDEEIVKKVKKTPKGKKTEKSVKKSNGQRKSTKKINKKDLTKTFGKKFFLCKVKLDCSGKEDEDEEDEDDEPENAVEEEDEIIEEKEADDEIETMEIDKAEEVADKTEELKKTPVKETILSSDDDSIFGDSKRPPKSPVRRNSKSPSPFSKLLAESKREKEILPPIVVTEDDLSQTGVSETTSEIGNLNEIGLSSSNGDFKTANSDYLNCFDSSQEDLNLTKTLPFLANEVDKLILDLDK